MLIHCFRNLFFEHESTSNDWAAVLRFGFLKILWQVLRLAPGALLVGGPPCNTWVFMNSGTSRRTRNRVLGDQKKKSVKDSNANLGKIVWAICFSHLDSIYSMHWSWMINIVFTTKLIIPIVVISWSMSMSAKDNSSMDYLGTGGHSSESVVPNRTTSVFPDAILCLCPVHGIDYPATQMGSCLFVRCLDTKKIPLSCCIYSNWSYCFSVASNTHIIQ